MARQITFQGARFVLNAVDAATGQVIVGQLHDVVQVVARSTDVQNVDEPIVGARDRFECRHALELALKCALAFEGDARHHFYRAPCAGKAARQPDFTIRAATNDAEDLMIRDEWDLWGNGRFRRALAQRISDGGILHKGPAAGNLML